MASSLTNECVVTIGGIEYTTPDLIGGSIASLGRERCCLNVPNTLKEVRMLCAARVGLIFSDRPWMYGMVMDVSGFSLSEVGVGRTHLREACRTKVDG